MTDTPRFRLTNGVAALAMAGAALLMSGCAGLNSVTSEVSSYGSWPAGRVPSTYTFERLPSQQLDSPLQSQVEAAAAPALAMAGFKPAATPEAADVLVQVAAQSHAVPSPWRERGGPFGPYGRFGMGGFFGRGHVGVGLGMSLEPPLTEMQVDVLIRDRRAHQVLYETHAVRQNNGGWDERMMAPMFQAALKDFPLPAISPRVVTIPLPPKDAAPDKTKQ
ncbi:MAG: DUF4136 domain-containing protein [Rubrivivax sp.]|nr:MAG: DUF4136 domain-containing protein [Rubrivivax sp.]